MQDKHFIDQRHRLPAKLRAAYQRKFGVVAMDRLAPSIEAWFDSPLGQGLIQAEQVKLDRVLGYMFGYHLLQLSVDRRIKLFGTSKINHCFGMHPLNGEQDIYTGVCNYEHLPLAKATVDVALLHHVLDFAAKPHRLLREVVRTLAPHGYVVIVGFNPLSAMGLTRYIARHTSKKPFQRSHALRQSRVIDWLRLLDCEPVCIEQGYFRLPINSGPVVNNTAWLDKLGNSFFKPCGSFYMIIARKEQASITPLKPQWQPKKLINGFSVGKVAPRVPESSAIKTPTKTPY